ncbi:MAG: soluble lytic murein transglycosylase-like protein [Planctomycetota bacterium]|jgi:soluble lytic murein transglycosylase-like protein
MKSLPNLVLGVLGKIRAGVGLLRRRSGRLLALFPMLLVLGWVGWIALDRSGVRAGLEGIARDYVAAQQVREHREELMFAAKESGVDPYLLAGIMWVESSGRIDVVSSADALGLFQLKEITYVWRAELMGLPTPTREDMLSDAMLNARIGANNVAWLLDNYGGDVERTLVAYNAGPGRLAQLANEAGSWDRLAESRRGTGSPIFAYAAKVMRYREAFREDGYLDEDVDVSRTLLNTRE